jgi:non-ribosomal peptide synthetase component E (peptide arylation enzyme)
MLSSVRCSVPLASRRTVAAARPLFHRQAHSVAAELDRRADIAADAPALIVPHQGLEWSYQELRDKAHSLATGLQVTG